MSESEVNERETNLNLLVTMDIDSLSREVSNKLSLNCILILIVILMS
jgi:hypothetical protein